MDISVKLEKLIAKLRIPCYALGIEYMDPNFKISRRTVTIAVFIGVYLTCSMFTIFTAESHMVWQCLAFFGMGAQGCVKFPIPLHYRQQGLYSLHTVRSLYQSVQHQKQASPEYKLLNTCVNVCDKVFNVNLLVFAGGFLITLSYPLIMYFVFDEKVLMITIIIPGVEPFGQYGFIIHGVCHATMAAIACTGSPAGDFYFMFNVAHIWVFVEFLRYRIERFNEWLLATQNQNHDKDWHENSKRFVNEILVEHGKLLEFIDVLDEMYFIAIAVHVGTATVSLGIGLFMTVTVSVLSVPLRPTGPRLLPLNHLSFTDILVCCLHAGDNRIVSTVCLLIFGHHCQSEGELEVWIKKNDCFLSSILQNDSLVEYVNETLWYLLPVAEQKKMILLLMRCQNPKEFTIAGMASLNLDTLVKVSQYDLWPQM
jgi:7tm Odorant receptor